MKLKGTYMNNKITGGLLGLVSLFMASTASASTVSVTPDPLAGVPGGLITASVLADFSDVAGGVSGGGFHLTWDPTVLTLVAPSGVSADINNAFLAQFLANGADIGFEFTNATVAGQLDFGFSLCTNTHGCDTLSVFNMFDLTFSVAADATGNSLATLGIANIFPTGFNDANDVPLTTPIVFNGASVIIAPVATVPVPAAAWLFASGLLGLVGVARRRVA